MKIALYWNSLKIIVTLNLIISSVFASPISKNIELIGFEVNPSEIVSKKLYSKKDKSCNPTALFNSLILSNAEIGQEFLSKLGNGNKKNKYNNFLSYAQKVAPHLYADGMASTEAYLALNEINADANEKLGLQPTSFHRSPKENQDKFLHRIHEYIKHSIERGFPPVVSIHGFYSYFDEETKQYGQKQGGAHALTITAVQKSIADKNHSFIIELLDPDDGLIFNAMISNSSYEKHYGSMINVGFNPLTGEELASWSANIDRASPYLHVSIGDIPHGNNSNDRGFWSRHLLLLKFGLGIFNHSLYD